jgi:glutathione S-transferase
MKLYFNPQSRAAITKWMLDECGATYELEHIDFEAGEHKTPEFLKINPCGKLPALVDDGVKIFENTAICLYLADKYPEANLAPAIDSPQRGRYLSLMIYSTSQLEPAMGDALAGAETSPQRGWTDFETVKDVVIGELGDGPFLFGEWFTAADVMIGSMFIWTRQFSGSLGRPELEAYADRLSDRPHAMPTGG